jgi:hypothetical protein
MIFNYKGSQGQTERAVVLQEEEVLFIGGGELVFFIRNVPGDIPWHKVANHTCTVLKTVTETVFTFGC